MKKTISMLCCICLILSYVTLAASADFETNGEAISFTQYTFSGSLSGNEEDVYVIRTVKELSKFLSMCDERNEFIDFASQLADDYFSEKALIVIYCISSSDSKYEITNVELTEYNQVAVVRYNENVGYYDDLEGHLIVAEVSADDAKDVEYTMNYMTSVLAYQTPIEFEDHFLGAYDTNGVQSGAPYYIETIDELYAFKELCQGSIGWNEFFEYVDNIQPEYFETKAMIIMYYLCSCYNSYFDVLAVYSDETGIQIEYTEDYAFEVALAEQPMVIIIEAAKSDIINSENITLNEITDTAVSTPLPPSEMLGDVFGDGRITSLDYFCLKTLIFGIEDQALPELREYMPRADINGDGKLTAVDYLMLKRMIFTGTTAN